MTGKSSEPGFLHQPPKLHPVTAFTIGAICIPAGLVVQGSIGGGLIGGGIGAILMGIWDTFRLQMGMIDNPQENNASEPPDRIQPPAK
jgi:hypothetical protein